MMSSLADTSSQQALSAAGHIDLQSQSPLFKLPSEIRYDIWRLAVQAEDDPTRPFEADSNYFRPGHSCFKRIHTALLLSCRRVYLETYDLPLSQNVMTFWAYRGPKGEPAMAKNGDLQELSRQSADADYDEDDTPWHFEPFRRNPHIPIQYIREAHWFVQQFWLECDNFYFMTVSKEMANVESLTITLRRSDFWNWEQLRPIGIDPRWPASVTQSRMKDIWNKDLAGTPVEAHPEAWGSHIQNLKHLKLLVIELETEMSQVEELNLIVNHAKLYWSFPHHTGQHLICNSPVKIEEWRGPRCMAARQFAFQRVSERPHLVKYSLSFQLSS